MDLISLLNNATMKAALDTKQHQMLSSIVIGETQLT